MFTHVREKVYGNEGNPALLDLLPPLDNKRILDLGCGTGANLRAARRKNNQVIGLTLSPIEALHGRAAGLNMIVADLTRNLPFLAAERFDVIVLSHVLEHFANPAALLQAARGALSEDGHIAIAVPSVTHYPVRLRHLFGDWTYCDSGILDWTHVRFFSLTGIETVIRQVGLQVTAAGHDGALPLWRLRKVLPRRFIAWLNREATRWWPELFANQFVFLAKACDPTAGRSELGGCPGR